jgi:hypothetical protein
MDNFSIKDGFRKIIIWNYLWFGNFFLLVYSGKYGFLKGQKHLLILLGFWGNFVIEFYSSYAQEKHQQIVFYQELGLWCCSVLRVRKVLPELR